MSKKQLKGDWGWSKKIIILTLLIIALTCAEAYARFQMQANCSYQTGHGMSQPSLFTVEFTTGRELNQETHSSAYRHFSNYVIIWFPPRFIQSQRRFAIVEIRGQVIMTDGTFRPNNLPQTFKKISGQDEIGIFWEIRW